MTSAAKCGSVVSFLACLVVTGVLAPDTSSAPVVRGAAPFGAIAVAGSVTHLQLGDTGGRQLVSTVRYPEGGRRRDGEWFALGCGTGVCIHGWAVGTEQTHLAASGRPREIGALAPVPVRDEHGLAAGGEANVLAAASLLLLLLLVLRRQAHPSGRRVGASRKVMAAVYYRPYATGDAALSVACGCPSLRRKFIAAVGHADPALAGAVGAVDGHYAGRKRAVEATLASRTIEEWTAILTAAGVPGSRVAPAFGSGTRAILEWAGFAAVQRLLAGGAVTVSPTM